MRCVLHQKGRCLVKIENAPSLMKHTETHRRSETFLVQRHGDLSGERTPFFFPSFPLLYCILDAFFGPSDLSCLFLSFFLSFYHLTCLAPTWPRDRPQQHSKFELLKGDFGPNVSLFPYQKLSKCRSRPTAATLCNFDFHCESSHV